MDFAPPGQFSSFARIYTPSSPEHTAVYPSFTPDGSGIVFELEVRNNGKDFGGSRADCSGPGDCADRGARGELWWVDLNTRRATRLDKLNGAGYLPVGDQAHDGDATLNYEPTVGPVASGGYAWVVFTSRRLYGNVATINPFWSDPRYHDISSQPTTKKLWVAAIDGPERRAGHGPEPSGLLPPCPGVARRQFARHLGRRSVPGERRDVRERRSVLHWFLPPGRGRDRSPRLQ